MNIVTENIGKLRAFVGEVGDELKKCTWPSRKELFSHSVLVVISVFILGAYVGLCDAVNMWLSKVIFR